MSIAVVTDSTADIPQDLAEKHNIHVVPAILIIDGQSIEDGKGLTRREFYERMPTMKTNPTTSTPSAGKFHDIYEKLFQQGFQEVISIHVSSLLSGIFNTANMAGQAFNKRVHVIDSGQLSLGLGFQALGAAKAAAEGLSRQKIIQQIKDIRERVRVFAMLDTLEYVRRSGRVSWARARIGAMLQIKPFLEVKDGKVLSLGQARTRKKGIPQLMEMIQKLGPIEQLAALHTNAENEARKMLETLKIPMQQDPLVVNVTTIVGTHVGPNGLGFAAVVK
jgi:DegV family protein with EDD domain